MFWAEPFDAAAAAKGCQDNWGVTPRKHWATLEWGGRRLAAASNIVFSNGLLDPWHGGGVMVNISDSVVAVIISEGAHHLDLMFSHPLDPDSVKEARRVELEHVARWVEGGYRRQGQGVWERYQQAVGLGAGQQGEQRGGGAAGAVSRSLRAGAAASV